MPRLLIVDDNPSIHRDFREILTPDNVHIDQSFGDLEAQLFGEEATTSNASAEFDIEIDSAFQGEEAIDMVASANSAGEQYFMAFVDVRMPPGIDGVETIRRLWNIDPQLNVVICTAFSDYSWKQLIDRLGPAPNLLILRKPFESIEVRQMAMAMLVRQSQRSESQSADRVHSEIHEAMVHALLKSVQDGVAIFDHSCALKQLNPAGHSVLATLPASWQSPIDGRPTEPLGELQRHVRDLVNSARHGPIGRQYIEIGNRDVGTVRLRLQLHQIVSAHAGPPTYLCVFTRVGDD